MGIIAHDLFLDKVSKGDPIMEWSGEPPTVPPEMYGFKLVVLTTRRGEGTVVAVPNDAVSRILWKEGQVHRINRLTGRDIGWCRVYLRSAQNVKGGLMDDTIIAVGHELPTRTAAIIVYSNLIRHTV